MGRSFLAFLLVASSSCAAWAYEADDHWTRTATQGSFGSSGSVGLPTTLTWSFPPDGTLIPANSGGTTPSNLRSFLDTNWPGGTGTDLAQRPWFHIFQQSFDRLSALSGLTFEYEPADTGTTFANTTAARGVLGTRGDIRIGGKSYGSGSNTLASNFGPDYGEMMINTDKASFFRSSSNNYRGFRNTIMHEAMHGVGIAHVESSTSGFLIEPILSTSFDGPQLDDILALQRLYGDAHEKNGDNNVFSRATTLGVVTQTQPRTIGTNGATTAVAATHTDFVSIDDESDIDFFKFTLQQSLDVSLTLTPQGTTYMVGRQGETQASFNSAALSNLALSLISGNGSTVLTSANLGGLGAAETIVRQLDPGDYYARVTGAQNDIQLYKLLISAVTPAPEELVWIGSTNNQWDVGATANFINRNGAEEFQNGDLVRFDDRTSVREITIAENVSPGSITVATGIDSDYVFNGPGGIIGGSLTVTGSGRVELANSNNSYDGPTQVVGGTLAITGDASAMVSAIEISSGATLVLDPLDAGAMASSIAVSVGGTLQIGTTASERNVFPDNPAGVTNEGTIRILDSERISSVSGGGQIVAEQAGIELADNGGFNGLVTVKSGATVDVTDALGLGADVEQTLVEEGGSLRLAFDGVLTERVSLAGNAGGQGALRVADGRQVEMPGGVSLNGGDVQVVLENLSDVLISSVVSAESATELTVDVAELASLQVTGDVVLAGGGLTKRGIGSAELSGSVIDISGADVQEGRLFLGDSGDIGGNYLVAQNALLEVGDARGFSDAAILTGAGQVAGNVVMAGTIAPGPDAARLEFTGNLQLATTSLIQFEAGGLAAGATYDDLFVFGSATLGGTLELTLDDGFVPMAGDMFELLHAGEVLGTFDVLALPTLDAALEWTVTYVPNAVVLSVAPAVAADPADFNGNGVVDGEDLQVWLSAFGSSAETPPLAGDADGDLIVGGHDFLIWQQNLTPPPTPNEAAAVPEPTVLAVLLTSLGALGLLRREERQ